MVISLLILAEFINLGLLNTDQSRGKFDSTTNHHNLLSGIAALSFEIIPCPDSEI